MNTGAYQSAMSTIFLDAIEFYDSNNNAKYDPDIDIIIQTVPLSSQQWDNMCSSQCENNTIAVFNISTVTPYTDSDHPPHPSRDPAIKFSIETTLSQILGETDMGSILTPRSMKISIKISEFPYRGYKIDNDNNKVAKTHLALSAVIGSSHINGSSISSFDPSRRSIRSGEGKHSQLSLSWDDKATVDGHHHVVRSSGFAPFTDFQRIGDAAMISNHIFIYKCYLCAYIHFDIFDFYVDDYMLVFRGRPHASVDFKQVYFTFDSPQPKSVYWVIIIYI